jgi:amino acid adenylation domain-containing protein
MPGSSTTLSGTFSGQHEWNRTETAYPRDLSIADAFEEQARRSPTAIAVSVSGRRYTYRWLNEAANGVARDLAARVAPGSVVAVQLERGAELIVALLAIAKAGCAYLPLASGEPQDRLRFMLADSSAAFVVDDPEWIAGIPAGSHRPDRRSGPDDLAYVTYTSGSTGKPKGVAVTQRNVVSLVYGQRYIAFGDGDAYLALAAPAFDASTFEIWAPLLHGSTVVVPLAGPLGLDELAEVIDREAVSVLFLTTALFHRIVDLRGSSLDAVRWLLVGGEVVSPDHVRRHLSRERAGSFVHVYGPTETTTFALFHPIPRAQDVEEPLPLGRPLANRTAYVLTDDLEPTAEGEIGEICLGGDGVSDGYVNRPELTRERFITATVDGRMTRLYRTGDLGSWRRPGVIDFHGRRDSQLKLNGFRVEPGEVEVCLLAHAGVRQAAVGVTTTPSGRRLLTAWVVSDRPQHALEPELRSHLRSKLPHFMQPHRVLVVAELPVNANGKIDRVRLETSSPRMKEATA